MKITVNSAITLKSESASKKAQNNAKTLFGTKGVSILSKLEEYKKERILNTDNLNTLLRILSESNLEYIEKFAQTSAGKNAAKTFKALADAKTFPAVMKALKAAKVPASIFKVVLKTDVDKADSSFKKRNPTGYAREKQRLADNKKHVAKDRKILASLKKKLNAAGVDAKIRTFQGRMSQGVALELPGMYSDPNSLVGVLAMRDGKLGVRLKSSRMGWAESTALKINRKPNGHTEDEIVRLLSKNPKFSIVPRRM